jgi:hypothetical protein
MGNDVLLVRGTIAGVTQQVERPVADKRGRVRMTGRGRARQPVIETVDEPLALQAQGWVSALENHYADDAYDDDGNLKLKRGKKARGTDAARRSIPSTTAAR